MRTPTCCLPLLRSGFVGGFGAGWSRLCVFQFLRMACLVCAIGLFGKAVRLYAMFITLVVGQA